MVKVTLDTSFYVNFCKGHTEAIQLIQSADAIYIPFIVLAELKAGFKYGKQDKKNEKGLKAFLSSDRVSVLYADEGTISHYADIYYQLRQGGKPIPTNDLWIAALTKQNTSTLVTFDKHFNCVQNLKVVVY